MRYFRTLIEFKFCELKVEKESRADVLDKHIQITLAELLELMDDDDFSSWEKATLCLSIADIRKLLLVRFLMSYSDAHSLQRMAESLGIRITPKDRARGTQFIILRILAQYDKPQSHALLYAKLRRTYIGKEDKETMGEPAFEHLSDKLGDLQAIQKDSDESRKEMTLTLIGYHYASVLEEEFGKRWVRWLWETHDPDGEVLLEELSVSLRNYALAKVFRGAVTSKQPAVTLESLQAENEELKAQYEQDMRLMATLLAEFRVAKAEGKEPERPLLGKTILVIGDEARMPAYRTLIEVLGGECLFSPGFDKYAALGDQVQRADGILFITSYASHGKYFLLKSHADMQRTVMVNRCGVATFREGLRELQKKIS